MGQCYITRRGTKIGGISEQLGVYPTGTDGRPTGDVTVLNNVTNLSSHLFQNNDKVSNVSLPENLQSIENNAFQKCINLEQLEIPNTITSIPNYCFDDCSSMSEVKLPDNLTQIGEYAFRNTGVTSILLSDKLTSIGQYGFSNCSELTSIHFSENLTTIENHGFYNCNNLETVTCDEKASVFWKAYCFAGCSKLTNESVHNIMEHYKDISDHAFTNCLSLTNVEVSRFWTSMFEGCSNLVFAKSLVGVNTGNKVFYNCKKLEEVYIAEGTTTIGTIIFYGCTSLKKVFLPASIVTATSSSLTSTSSSYYIFYNCTALEDVQLGEDWDMSLRLNVSDNLTVESMVAMFESLKDLTGTTSKTLTLGSTNLAKLTGEQKLIAINKNWTLA